MKKIISFLFVFCVTMCLAQEVTITKVQQRYPWNGLVDIEFEVPSATFINLHAINLTTSTEIEMKTIFDSTGKTVEQPFQVSAGTHTITWNSIADAPNTTKETIKIFVDEFKYTVRFNANGGNGTMSDQLFTYSFEQALSLNTFTREGYIFDGWATSANGDIVYTDGEVVKNLIKEVNGIVNLFAIWHKYVQLWKDGPYWAEINIGAENAWDYGYYFWWGDTIGYIGSKKQGDKWVSSDGSLLNDFGYGDIVTTYRKTYSKLLSDGWITSSGVLAPEHDAARAHWGENWRMPTNSEFHSLIDNCTWTRITTNGVNGYKVSGKGSYSGASIFLPAGGRIRSRSLDGLNSNCHYWSSVPNSNTDYGSYYLLDIDVKYFRRSDGRSVRPVLDVKK